MGDHPVPSQPNRARSPSDPLHTLASATVELCLLQALELAGGSPRLRETTLSYMPHPARGCWRQRLRPHTAAAPLERPANVLLLPRCTRPGPLPTVPTCETSDPRRWPPPDPTCPGPWRLRSLRVLTRGASFRRADRQPPARVAERQPGAGGDRILRSRPLRPSLLSVLSLTLQIHHNPASPHRQLNQPAHHVRQRRERPQEGRQGASGSAYTQPGAGAWRVWSAALPLFEPGRNPS